VAGVALGDIDLHFAWQAWHLATWIVTCAASVALGDLDHHFARQAWHLATWIVTLRGRRGTWRRASSLCLAGVALGNIDRHFLAGVALGDMDRHLDNKSMSRQHSEPAASSMQIRTCLLL